MKVEVRILEDKKENIVIEDGKIIKVLNEFFNGFIRKDIS